MPRVPVYDGPQVREGNIHGNYSQAPQVGQNARAIQGGLAAFGQGVEQHQQRQNQDDAFAAEAQLKTEWINYESKLRETRKGRDAATYDQDVNAWWQDASQRVGQNLNPEAKGLVNRSLVSSQVQALAGAKAYKEQQLNASAAGSYDAAQNVAINEAATVGNEQAAQLALANMSQKRSERAALMGWTPEQTKEDEQVRSTTLHQVMTQKLMRQDPAAAQVYYDKYKSQITAPVQAQLEAGINQTSAAVDGGKAADSIWQQLGPKADGQPVELDKLDAAARQAFPNDPARQKIAREEIQSRAGAFNASERERGAANTNNVMDAYSKGASLAQLRALPEYQALPGKERNAIEEHIRDRNHAMWAQSVEDRARLEREQERKAFPSFLEYSNPDNLAQMSRQQVQALVPALGNSLTNHLVTKWDALQKPAAKLEARTDTEDFNHIADTMGLDPFKANSEDKKRALGELKYRVEQLIDVEQQKRKALLSRDEKLKMMQTEMASKVTVDGFFSNTEKPVIQLTEKDLSKVIVPDSDRSQIAAALQFKYRQSPNPMYAPTEANMRRLYLQAKSKSSALLPAEKP